MGLVGKNSDVGIWDRLGEREPTDVHARLSLFQFRAAFKWLQSSRYINEDHVKQSVIYTLLN